MKIPPGTIIEHLRLLYPSNRFFIGLGAAVILAAMGFWFVVFYYLAIALLIALVLLTGYDAYRLYGFSRSVSGERITPKVFSLGDRLSVTINLHNRGTHRLSGYLIDELPEQLQVRDHHIAFELPPETSIELSYALRPTVRGEYHFGVLNLYVESRIGLLERRLLEARPESVPVFPSIVQMKKFAVYARETVSGERKRRRPQQARSYEFDQIKEYVRGDDYRSINWRATGRRGELMVNQYEEERAQRIYCLIDRGRTMLMPFNELSLLDYAINATLALSNVVLQRRDRAGLITFGDRLGDVLPADSKSGQLRRIMDLLYRQREHAGESDFELLHHACKRFVSGRSLLMLFTNFGSTYALDRALPALRRIARGHRLVIVLFENTEIDELLETEIADTEAVYRLSTARTFKQERRLLAARLRQNGIQVILTRPEELTASVIERYLSLKSSGI